jgi:hypothetical protein
MVVCPFVPFLLAIAFSGLLRLTTSDYPFDIFKLSLLLYRHQKPDIMNGDTKLLSLKALAIYLLGD